MILDGWTQEAGWASVGCILRCFVEPIHRACLYFSGPAPLDHPQGEFSLRSSSSISPQKAFDAPNSVQTNVSLASTMTSESSVESSLSQLAGNDEKPKSLESRDANCSSQQTYPPKLDDWNFFDKRYDSELVQAALRGGLDPNTRWTKEELEEPGPTGGCVLETSLKELGAWKHCNTPLHLAVLGTDYESAEIILSYGGDIDIYNDAGKTPVHEAVFRRSLERVRFLVQHGADLNRPTRAGLVPLQSALRDGDEEFFFSILELGASSQRAGHFAWSIADLALLSSEQGILARLMIDHAMLPTPMFGQSEASQRSKPEEFGVATRRLLAVVSSSQLLPAAQLYEAYEFLLHSLDFHQGPVWDFQAVEDLIESFNTALYCASNTPRLALNEKFCPSCLEFQSSVARSCRDIGSGLSTSTTNLQIHKNRAELEDCAGVGCPLCSMIAAELYKKDYNTPKWPATHDESKTSKRRKIDYESCPNTESSPITLEVGKQIFLWMSEQRRFTRLNARLANFRNTGVCFDLEGVDTRFGKPIDDGCRANTTGSTHALGTAKRWLEICQTSPTHSQCQEAYRETSHGLCSPLPTRVLHVGSDHKDPFLFESRGAKGSYCILSYCWGRTANATTTKKNLSERMKGIPLASLPMLICEAILTARFLGFEYIWIDALCIIQDDDQDWAHEASVMHELYSRADLTITSLIAGDSRDSLFQPRPDQACRPIPLDLGLPKRDRPDFKDDTVFQLSAHPENRLMRQTPRSGPIHQRAWTLQEQVMSRRILYFGAGVLHWECLHDYLLEPYPSAEGTFPNFHSTFHRQRQHKLVIRGLSQADQTQSDEQDPLEVWPYPLEVWQRQVEEFTKRHMTKRSDRIPAFLAISTSIGAVINEEFVGGIWKGDSLLESLCWRLSQPDTTDPRGPTWTWASRSGQVQYSYLDHEGRKTRKALVISCDVSVTDQSQSHVFGSITLKGTLSTFRHKYESHRWESFDHSVGSLKRCYTFDLLEFERGPIPTGFGYPEYPDGQPGTTVRLLLRPVNDDEDFWTASLFQRIGIVSHMDPVHRVPQYPEGYWDDFMNDRRSFDTSQMKWVTPPSYWSQIVQDIQSDRVVTIV